MPGARVVLAGIPDEDSTTFTASLARRKGLTLVLVRRMKEVYPRAAALVERGLIDVRSLVSRTFELVDAEHALATAHARSGLKVIVTPDIVNAFVPLVAGGRLLDDGVEGGGLRRRRPRGGGRLDDRWTCSGRVREGTSRTPSSGGGPPSPR